MRWLVGDCVANTTTKTVAIRLVGSWISARHSSSRTVIKSFISFFSTFVNFVRVIDFIRNNKQTRRNRLWATLVAHSSHWWWRKWTALHRLKLIKFVNCLVIEFKIQLYLQTMKGFETSSDITTTWCNGWNSRWSSQCFVSLKNLFKILLIVYFCFVQQINTRCVSGRFRNTCGSIGILFNSNSNQSIDV